MKHATLGLPLYLAARLPLLPLPLLVAEITIIFVVIISQSLPFN